MDLVLGNAWLCSYCNPEVSFLRVTVQRPSLHEVHDHVLLPTASLRLCISADAFVCSFCRCIQPSFFRADDMKWLRLCHLTFSSPSPGSLCRSAHHVHDEWWLDSSNGLFLLWGQCSVIVYSMLFFNVLVFLNQALRHTKAFPPLSREYNRLWSGRLCQMLSGRSNMLWQPNILVCAHCEVLPLLVKAELKLPSMWHFNRCQFAIK